MQNKKLKANLTGLWRELSKERGRGGEEGRVRAGFKYLSMLVDFYLTHPPPKFVRQGP